MVQIADVGVLASHRVGNAAVPSTHITSVHGIMLEKKVVKA